MSKETYAPWDTAEILKNDKIIVEYLQAALEENDPAFFVKAVGNVAPRQRYDPGCSERPGGPSKSVQGFVW